mgnify:CR=1 FL=1
MSAISSFITWLFKWFSICLSGVLIFLVAVLLPAGCMGYGPAAQERLISITQWSEDSQVNEAYASILERSGFRIVSGSAEYEARFVRDQTSVRCNGRSGTRIRARLVVYGPERIFDESSTDHCAPAEMMAAQMALEEVLRQDEPLYVQKLRRF